MMSAAHTAATAKAGFFGSIKVRTRILLGFGAVLAVLLIISALGYKQFMGLGHNVDSLAVDVEKFSQISRIETEFLKLQMHARDFANKGLEASAKKVVEIAKELFPLIDEFTGTLKEGDQRKQVKNIRAALSLYLEDFGKAKVLEEDYKALVRDHLDPNGARLIEDLDQLLIEAAAEGNADAVIYITTAREHALKAEMYSNLVLGRSDQSYAPKVEKEFAALGTALESMGKTLHTKSEKKILEETVALFLDYEKSFASAHKDETLIAELVDGKMAQAGKEIARDAGIVERDIRTSEEAIRNITLETVASAEREMLIAAVLGLLIGGILAWFIGRSISSPIVGLTSVMGTLANGDLTADIPFLERGDEIGEMAAAVEVFKANGIRNKEMEAEAEEQKHQTEKEKRRVLLEMADNFESSVGGVVNAVSSASTEMQASAQTLSATAEETSQQSAAVAAASEEASTNVQTVAAASEELSSSISEISRQVAQSTQIASAAVAEVNGANEKVQGLAQAAQKIGEVVALITDIADQTNLLALNATIEAARAGEAGKGFAVVASEVKNLANATAKATEEISTQIGGIQNATEDAVAAIGSIGGTIDQMNEIASTIAAAVEEQGAATQEIARNVEQAAAGTNEVSSNITGVNEAATNTGQSADELLSAATELSQQSELLRVEVDGFLNNIRKE